MVMEYKPNRPILITGSHRSGSTLVGKIIEVDSNVGYIHEPFNYYINRKGICNAKFDKFFTYINYENENYFYKDIKKTLDFSYSLFAQLKTIKSKKDVNYLISEYLHFQKYKKQGVRPLLKDPFALLSSEWLAEKFDMNVIILIRHPAAFANSLKSLNWSFPFSHLLAQPLLIRDYLYPFESEIIEYSSIEKPIIDQAGFLWKMLHYIVKKYQEKGKSWLFLRHEDISKDPLKTFSHILNYLNLNISNSTLQMIHDYCGSSNKNNEVVNDPYLLKRPSELIYKNWSNELEKDEIQKLRNQVEEISTFFYTNDDW